MREDIIRTIGVDLGDKWSHLCVLDEAGEIVSELRIHTTDAGFRGWFSKQPRGRVALEASTHSHWVARLLEELEYEVIVANPRQIPLITRNDRKCDRTDAELLARLARSDPKLLSPVVPRSAQIQADRSLIVSRDVAVRARTMLINHVRGSCKAFGAMLPSCSTPSFAKKVAEYLPEELRAGLEPILALIAQLTKSIRAYLRQIEEVAEERYSAAGHLRQVRGVGPITSLAFVLAIGDPDRFSCSRKVGAFLGLAPGRDQSGGRDPQQRITRAGDPLVRRLLLQSAHYIMGPFGEDCDLRRWAERKCEHGGKSARKRAVVAVARKLGVVMHRIWITGETYEPLRLARERAEAAA